MFAKESRTSADVRHFSVNALRAPPRLLTIQAFASVSLQRKARVSPPESEHAARQRCEHEKGQRSEKETKLIDAGCKQVDHSGGCEDSEYCANQATQQTTERLLDDDGFSSIVSTCSEVM